MLLFDLDGTLIDSNGIWVDVDLRFLGRHGLTPTEEYTYAVGHSIFPVAAEFTREYYGLDLTPEEIMEEWLSMTGDAYAHGILEYIGAEQYLYMVRSLLHERSSLSSSKSNGNRLGTACGRNYFFLNETDNSLLG